MTSSKRNQSVPAKSASSKKRKSLLKSVPRVKKDGLVPSDTWTPRKRFISKYKTLKDTLEEVIATERAYRSININQIGHRGRSHGPCPKCEIINRYVSSFLCLG